MAVGFALRVSEQPRDDGEHLRFERMAALINQNVREDATRHTKARQPRGGAERRDDDAPRGELARWQHREAVRLLVVPRKPRELLGHRRALVRERVAARHLARAEGAVELAHALAHLVRSGI